MWKTNALGNDPVRTIRSLLAVVAAGSVGVAVAPASPPPQHLRNAQITGHQMATGVINALEVRGDGKLEWLLTPGFGVQRANGSWAMRAPYLDTPIIVRSYASESSHTEYPDGVLGVRRVVDTSESIGGAAFGTNPAPRLSTFGWSGSRWRTTSQANFDVVP